MFFEKVYIVFKDGLIIGVYYDLGVASERFSIEENDKSSKITMETFEVKSNIY